MKYLCLVYLEEDKWNAVRDNECLAASVRLHAEGHVIAAEPLHPVHTATTLRLRDGALTMTDGPFAETKEQLAGFYLFEAADLDEAVTLAARIPPVRVGSIEVRPVRELDPNG
ncbi:MAG: YciI family protein [Pseudomonadota bacterium]|nr:YciI family protein [Pseudomonadota bacterium]